MACRRREGDPCSSTRSARWLAGARRRERHGKRGKEKSNKNGGTHNLEGELEALQKWRFGGKIWRGMQNAGPFRGLLELIFCIKPLNLVVEAVSTGVALMPYPKRSGESGMTRIYLVKTL
jgi:hypothetical protein